MISKKLLAIVCGVTICVGGVQAQDAEPEIKSVVSAENAVAEARDAIESGKALLAQIPADSPVMSEVFAMLKASSESWTVAVEALDGAKKSLSKADSSNNPSVADDFRLLAEVNANVALSGAKVVQIALSYIETAAAGKTEALSTIDAAMQDALAASSQVQMNYDQVKKLIAAKYSK